MTEQDSRKQQMKTLARVDADLEKLDEAGLRYVIDRAQNRLNAPKTAGVS